MNLKTQKNRGFTLLEMMLVVMIIATLLAAAIHFMGGNLGYAQDVTSKADIDSITTQLKMYQAMNGFLPTTEQGLQALVTRPDSQPKPTQWRQLLEKFRSIRGRILTITKIPESIIRTRTIYSPGQIAKRALTTTLGTGTRLPSRGCGNCRAGITASQSPGR